MRRGSRLSLLIACVAALLLPAMALAQRAPRDLEFVDGHWTAWNPPIVEPGQDVHIIEAGDTLWDLAERYYGDPYLWPQIWELNQYIEDSHWIYPGDPLLLGLEVESGDLDQWTTTDTQPDDEEDVVPTFEEGMFGRPSSFVQLGSPDDIYCSGYIAGRNEEFPFHIAGTEHDSLVPSMDAGRRGKPRPVFRKTDRGKVGMSTGDIVYLDGGRNQGMSPGDVFTAVEPHEIIEHPVTREFYGRYYRYLGQVRVLSVQDDTSIAEIYQGCQTIPMGSGLKPFIPEPIPSERRTPLRPINEPTSAESLADAPRIVHAKDGVIAVGQDHVVFLDLNDGDGVEPGDIFTVYRTAQGELPVILGEVAVLSVHSTSSVAKVIASRYAIYVGDALERK